MPGVKPTKQRREAIIDSISDEVNRLVKEEQFLALEVLLDDLNGWAISIARHLEEVTQKGRA